MAEHLAPVYGDGDNRRVEVAGAADATSAGFRLRYFSSNVLIAPHSWKVSI
jgi:hypothetical protein